MDKIRFETPDMMDKKLKLLQQIPRLTLSFCVQSVCLKSPSFVQITFARG